MTINVVIGAGAGRPHEMIRPTQDIAVSLARHGVPYGVICRSLMVDEARVLKWLRDAVSRREMDIMPPRERDVPYVERALRSRIDELEEQVESLKIDRTDSEANAAAFGQSVARVVFDVPRRHAQVLAYIMENPSANKLSLFRRIYDDEPEAPDPKIIDVLVCQMRGKLRWLGFRIETIWGIGYRVPKHHVDWWYAIVETAKEIGVDEVRRRLVDGEILGPEGRAAYMVHSDEEMA